MTEDDRILTPAEVAGLFDVEVKTVLRWAQLGKLPSFRTPGGHHRYRLSDVEAAFAKAQERTP